jgi:hypothetical protein
MAIDYLTESEKYRPSVIERLLIGEAPPPSGKVYFYVPPERCTTGLSIEEDTSLPATIFHHYFQQRPECKEEYEAFLRRLQEQGVFLIDICNEAIKVRGCPDGVQRIIDEIPNLRRKMVVRGINVADKNMVFLLPRKSYSKHLREAFPESRRLAWKEFRLHPEPP